MTDAPTAALPVEPKDNRVQVVVSYNQDGSILNLAVFPMNSEPCNIYRDSLSGQGVSFETFIRTCV